VHLDIETDDTEADVARLTALGTREVDRPRNARWVVMEAPAGQRFRMVCKQRADFSTHLNRWD
jgi:hypothetical protein